MYEIKLIDGRNGSIQKTPSGVFRLRFTINGKNIDLGSFSTQELAEEARRYFINECSYDLDKYKESKHWKESRNIGSKSENYVKQGHIYKDPGGNFQLQFFINGKRIKLGAFSTRELVEEARQYFINECKGYDLDKYKESKYWLEKNDRRQTSKGYWENGKLNKKNTSGVNGVLYIKNKKGWEARISINKKLYRKLFRSFENAVEFRNYLTQLGNEFNADWDEKRKEEQMQFIKKQADLKAKELRSNEKEKEAIEELKKQGEEVDMNYEEDTSTWDSKRGEKTMKNYNIGDSVKLKSGRTGVVEDFDDKYYYVKDSNCNIIKVKRVNDTEDLIKIGDFTVSLKNAEIIDVESNRWLGDLEEDGSDLYVSTEGMFCLKSIKITTDKKDEYIIFSCDFTFKGLARIETSNDTYYPADETGPEEGGFQIDGVELEPSSLEIEFFDDYIDKMQLDESREYELYEETEETGLPFETYACMTVMKNEEFKKATIKIIKEKLPRLVDEKINFSREIRSDNFYNRVLSHFDEY